MIFEPGRDSHGRTPLLDDGKPVYARCGDYYISRAVMSFGIVSDAWYKSAGMEIALDLASGVTARQAVKACKDHRDGLHPSVP